MSRPAESSEPDVVLYGDRVVLTDAARERLEQFRCTHDTQVLTILFSDLVGSTQLQVTVGNLRAAALVRRHYAIMRQTLDSFDGREISTAGDSMLIVFAAPSEAVKFALHAQHATRQERRQESLLPEVRIGLHQGQVVLQKDIATRDLVDIYGVQVSTAARIMSLAQNGQVLMSRAVFDDARTILRQEDFPGFAPLAWANHGSYRFKGLDEAYELCEAGETTFAPLSPPPAGSKGWPAPSAPDDAQQAAAVKPRERPQGSWGRRARWTAVSALAVALLIAGQFLWHVTQTEHNRATPPSPAHDSSPPALPSGVAAQLQQLDGQLSRFAGLDADLESIRALEKQYKEATKILFGREPDHVKGTALQILARLRTYDLTDDERKVVAKADALVNRTFVIYPEEVYHPVRELAEMLDARRKSMQAEQERLRAQDRHVQDGSARPAP